MMMASEAEASRMSDSVIAPVPPRESSSWVYAHELGRMYLEQKYGGKLQTVVFNNASTDSQVAQDISLAVASGCNVIFTTSPQMAAQSVKAAVENPQIRVFTTAFQ